MTPADLEQSVAALGARCGGKLPATALVLGSGLGPFGERMAQDLIVPYAEIPGFPVSTVPGHTGRLLIGRAGDRPLVCMQGRMHLYEGYSPAHLALPIRTLRRLGVERLILTNAAGGVARDLGPGALMAIADHINLSGQNPLIGPNDPAIGPRFFDMSNAYDRDLRATLLNAGARVGVAVRAGTYLFTLGPNFETPAEVRMMERLGADAVGMSTVPECLVANHCGMKVVGLSVITNFAAGISPHTLTHQETLAEAERAYARVERLLLAFLDDLSD